MNETSITDNEGTKPAARIVPTRRSSLFRLRNDPAVGTSITTRLCCIRYPSNYVEKLENEIQEWSEIATQTEKQCKESKKKLKSEKLNVCIDDLYEMDLPDLDKYVIAATEFVNKRAIIKYKLGKLQNYIKIKKVHLLEKVNLLLKSGDTEN